MRRLEHNLKQFFPAGLLDRDFFDRDPELRVADLITNHFDIFEATTEEARWASHRLRYLIYCLENDFEDPRSNESGLETDEFDVHAVHAIAVHRATQQPIATVRLVLRESLEVGERLSFEKNCNVASPFADIDLEEARIAEISRFGISKTATAMLRQQAQANRGPDQTFDPFTWQSERYLSNILFMLPIRGFIMLAAKYGITHYCALTAPSLLRRLAAFGVHFNAIGELVEYHGKRQPNISSVKALLDRAHDERVEVWSAIGGNSFEMQFESERVAAE